MSISLSVLSFIFASYQRESIIEKILKVKKERDCVRDLLIAAKIKQEVFSDLQRELAFISRELGRRRECMLVGDAWFSYLMLIDDVYKYARATRGLGDTIIKNLVIKGKEVAKYSAILRKISREYARLEEQIERSYALIARRFYRTRDKEEILKILELAGREVDNTVSALKEYLEKLGDNLRALEDFFKKLTLEHDSLVESIREDCRRIYLEKIHEEEEKYENLFLEVEKARELKRESVESTIKEYEGYLGLIDRLAASLREAEEALTEAIKKYDMLSEEARKEYEEECKRIREMPWEERMKLRGEVSNVKEMYIIAVKNLDPENWEYIHELEYEYWPAWMSFVKKLSKFWDEHVEEVKKTLDEVKNRYEIAVLGLKGEIEIRRKRVNDARERFIEALRKFEDNYIKARAENDKVLEEVARRLRECLSR